MVADNQLIQKPYHTKLARARLCWARAELGGSAKEIHGLSGSAKKPGNVKDYWSITTECGQRFLAMQCQAKDPRHVLHEKGLQRHLGVGTLASSQKETLFVLLVNRWLCSSMGSHGNSFVRASEEAFRPGVLESLGGKRVGCLVGEPTRRGPVLLAVVVPRRETRSARGPADKQGI